MKVTTQAPTYASVLQDKQPRPGMGMVGADKQTEIGKAPRLNIKDLVELRDPLDLTIGQDMLLSAIGAKINAMFKEHGIDLEDHVGEDMSVDATAGRIVDFATGFFDVWKEKHPDASEDELIDGFESTIRGAIEKGYGDAVNTLRGMESIQEGVFGTAQQTYDRMQELLDEKFAKLRSKKAAEDPDQVQIGTSDNLGVAIMIDPSFSARAPAKDAATTPSPLVDVLA